MRKFLILSLLITFLFTFVSPIYSAQSLSTKSFVVYYDEPAPAPAPEPAPAPAPEPAPAPTPDSGLSN
jgi:hypothetical protein